MFRRSRFSIRPNVGTAGRTAATSQEAPSVNQEASETPKDASESSTATDVTPLEKPAASEDGNDQNGEGTSSSAAVQRRKRFSVKPKVAPGRPSTLARTPKSPIKAVLETPPEVSVSDLDKPTTSSHTGDTAAPRGLQSPRRRRPSEDSKQPKVQPKLPPTSSDSSGPSAVPLVEETPEQADQPADSGKELESTTGSQVTEVPSRQPDKVPPSLPHKESIEISEKAKTLVSSKSGLSVSPPAFSLSRLLNDPSDLVRLAKARKLRELLREEMHKEKKTKRAKARAKEYTLDPAKMTMRDLIRYLPMSNPMSSLEESAQENETVIPPSPGREESPERAQEPEAPSKTANPRQEEVEEEVEEAEDEQEEALMVPQVKVAEDGSLIIDEESLTVEVQRAKGPNLAQERDPIFERGSTTTYSSFRKGTYSKPWSSEETDMFYLAISMVGTDFSMICQLFPHRARSEIKNKFKKEERENSWRIDKAFRERRKLDIEYFSKLLEKILEVQKNRKKLKSLADKNSPKKPKRKAKASTGKKATKKLSDVEGEDEEDENEIPDLEEEGEKENEDLCNDGGAPAAKPKRKRKRKNKEEVSKEEPSEKKNNAGEKSSEQDEACIPEDAEAALPEDRTNSNKSEKTDTVNAAKDAAIKPAKLSRGRAPKPALPLGRKWGKKPAPPSIKANDAVSDAGGEGVSDEAPQEQVNKDASPSRPANEKSANDDMSSEEEDVTIQPPKPTRYGRVPKPTKTLTFSAKEDTHSSSSETTPASPVGSTASSSKPKPKCTAKRGRPSKQPSAQESKKPKLVTLRATQSEYSDDENERQWEEEDVEERQNPSCSSSRDGIAPVFVPASLRSPHPVISEVEETMEELDILASMPDVLGISQDALCPDASCEQAQNETGTAEPSENQLDLLVDVIDLLSTEHTQVSEQESYNEAAQTLLTIGNLAHLSQSAQAQIAVQDHTTGTTSVSVNATSQHPHEPAADEEISAACGHAVTETSETVVTVELQNSATNNEEMLIKSSDQTTSSDIDPNSHLDSSPGSSRTNSLQARRGRFSKVKPKPNLGHSSRTAQSKSQPETSTVKKAEESHTVVPDLSQATEAQPAAEITPKMPDCGQILLQDDVPCTEVRHAEQPSGSQEGSSAGEVESGAATSDQSASENQSLCLFDTQFEPSVEQATREIPPSSNEMLESRVRTANDGCNELQTSDSVIPDTQTEHGTNVESAQHQESGDQPASCAAPVEDLPVSQKEESEVASTHRTRKSRVQKPKPNLANTSRTAHSKPKATKDASPKVEAEPPCPTSPDKPSQSFGSGSDLMPSMDFGLITSTEKPSTSDEGKAGAGVVCQVESGVPTSDQSASENLNSQSQFEPSKEQTTTDTRPTSPSAPHPEEKQESAVASNSQTRRGRFQKPKPNLPPTSRTKPQPTKDPVPHMQLMEKPSSSTSRPESTAVTTTTCSSTPPEKPGQMESTGTASDSVPPLQSCSTQKPAEDPSSAEEQRTDVECGFASSSEASDQNVPQRRRRFPKVKPKPNLGSSARTSQTKQRSHDTVQSSEQCPVDTSSHVISDETPEPPVDNNDAQTELKHEERHTKNLTPRSLHTEPFSSTELRPTESEKFPDSVLEYKSNKKPAIEGESSESAPSNNEKVKVGATSQDYCKKDLRIEDTVTNTQLTEQDGAVEANMESWSPINKQSKPDLKESTQQPRLESVSEAQSQDAIQQTSETPETGRAVGSSADDSQPDPSSTSTTSRKAPPARRGRLIKPKPKPNLGRSKQVQNAKCAETDSGAHSEHVDVPVSHKPASELQPDIREPVEGAIEQRSICTSSPNDAGSSVDRLTQVFELSSEPSSFTNDAGSSLSYAAPAPDFSAQVASASGTGGTQCLTMFPDMLSGQVPSDPDEPFFILSLTEIPVCSSGEVVDGASKSLPYLPVTEASTQQQQSSAPSNVAVSASTESSEAVITDIGPDSDANARGSLMDNPEDPHATAAVEPSETNDTRKQRRTGAGRTAKLQVRPSTHASESDPIQINTTQDSELPASSVEPQGFDEAATEPQKGSHQEDTEDTGRAQTTQTTESNRRKRNPKVSTPVCSESDNSAHSSNSPPSKALTKGRRVATQHAAGKSSSTAPEDSLSHDVDPTSGPTRTPEETHPTSTTPPEGRGQTSSSSVCTPELSASQQSESTEEDEEPTSVSQYFLSDIFTEVEEG